MSFTLPPKENALYKRVVKCYEHKMYKYGLKFSKQILANPKFAEHGETLAMKGLILNGLGKKEEAYEYVKKGLKNDLKSSVCWHVFGLLQRSDKKYDEAIKCYRNALKIDNENIQILKDLSLLQIQMRDLDGFRESTYQIFKLRPTQRISWVGYAVACHLMKDFDIAIKALDTFGKAITDDFELSEILLYQTMLFQESGDIKGAIDHLEFNSDKISDKCSLEETLASLYLQTNQLSKAEELVRKLLNRNPDNVDYYDLLSQSLNLKTNQEKVKLLRECIKKFPKSNTPKRLLLNYAESDEFKSSLESYLKAGLTKGIPSLFVDIRSLYKNHQKALIIDEVIYSFKNCLEQKGTFYEKDVEPEPVTALLWTYHFLAQHHDYKNCPEEALRYINMAIEHTPTLIELYVTKAKIYKHAGDAYEASKWMDEAQSFDTADRYINSICAKYMIRANLILEACLVVSNFTTEGEDVFTYLNDIECMFFELECAKAYARMENYGEALKKCHEIDRHFTQIIDDQYDFHSYCLKKMTLRSYVNLLRLEDVLRTHPFYQKAAHFAIDNYLKIFDRPTKKEVPIDNKEADLDPAELKKIRNKQRKAQKKAEKLKAQEPPVPEKQTHKRQAADPDSFKKVELIPEKLANDENPLESSLIFLKPLQLLASSNIDTHLLSYEVYRRMNKCLLMLQSVRRAWNLSKDHPLVHFTLIHFCLQIQLWKEQNSISPVQIAVIDNVMNPILNGRTLNEINKEFLKAHEDDLSCILQAGRVMYLLDQSKQKEAIKLVTCLDENLKSRDIKTCSDVLNSLKKDFGKCDESVEQYRKACRELFKFATVFFSPEDRELANQMKNLSLEQTSQTQPKEATSETETEGDQSQMTSETSAQKKKPRSSISPKKASEKIGKKQR